MQFWQWIVPHYSKNTPPNNRQLQHKKDNKLYEVYCCSKQSLVGLRNEHIYDSITFQGWVCSIIHQKTWLNEKDWNTGTPEFELENIANMEENN